MADHGKATPPEILQAIFLEAFATTGVISAAARIAGISKTTHYRWLADYPAYVESFAEAEKTATDSLIEEARRRATEGVDEPVMYQGKSVL
jgi:molybdenum-dependent DNA-binding transcriptional regulator ModE